MLWDLLAVVFAGLGGAGIAMTVRLFYKKLPSWLIPASAGLGMLLFHIINEYTWFDHTKEKLPQGAVVVAQVPETIFWKPWTLVHPQILKFIAADIKNAKANEINPNWMMVDLYFFERMMTTHQLPIVLDCQQKKQALLSDQLNPHAPQNNPSLWTVSDYTERLATQVCQK